MLGICSVCGNQEWDKEVEENVIKCPKCGNEWKFEKLPIYFLTGCSGIGKTTTAHELQPKFPVELYLGMAEDVRNLINIGLLTNFPLYKFIFTRYNYI